MKRKFNLKILAGFILLISILLVAGVISYSELNRLESSVNSLIDDNYKTIEATKSMIEALEREDSGILMILLGQWSQGTKILNSADSSFMASLAIAKGNLTEPGEDKYIEKITLDYIQFKVRWENLIENPGKDAGIDWYNNVLHADFLSIKRTINELLYLNQKSMFAWAGELKDKSRRAIMPGIMAIVTSIIFCVLFNFFITLYFTSPLNKIIHSISQIQPRDRKLGISVKTNDELKMLEREINNMIERLSKSER